MPDAIDTKERTEIEAFADTAIQSISDQAFADTAIQSISDQIESHMRRVAKEWSAANGNSKVWFMDAMGVYGFLVPYRKDREWVASLQDMPGIRNRGRLQPLIEAQVWYAEMTNKYPISIPDIEVQ